VRSGDVRLVDDDLGAAQAMIFPTARARLHELASAIS
jgi:hypothetical protein